MKSIIVHIIGYIIMTAIIIGLNIRAWNMTWTKKRMSFPAAIDPANYIEAVSVCLISLALTWLDKRGLL